MRKKLTLLFALLCVSVMGWAVQYCGETITATDGVTTAKLTCQKTGDNTYSVSITSTAASDLSGAYFNAAPLWMYINGNETYHVGEHFERAGNTISATITSSTTPTFYTSTFYFYYPGEKTFNLPNDIDFSAACGGSTPDSEDPVDPESATIDWSAQSWITNGTDKFKIVTVPAIEESFGVKQLLNNDIYIPFPSAVFGACSLGELNEAYTTDGAQIKVPQSTFSQQETHFTMVCESTTYDIYVYNATASAGGGGEDPTPAKVSECIGTKGHFDTPDNKKIYYQIDYADSKVTFTLRSLTEYALDFAEVQITGVGNYAMSADATGAYTYAINNPTLNAEWYIRFLYSDTNNPGNEQTAQTQDANDANIIYYKVGDGTSTTIENSNMALSSLGASATGTDAENNTPDKAIDGDVNTRWSSVWDTDPQDFVLDLGQRRSFNAIQFVWYTTYTRTFDLLISDDNVEWIPIKSVDRTLDNADNKEETIQLGGIYAARYIKFHGTVRGGGYGHSFREFRVLYATTPVLTTYSASLPGKFCTIGANYQIAVTALDQLGNDFALTSEYTISPLSAGTITTAGVYTPAQQGDATITVSGGGKVATINVRNEASANLALNKTATSGHDADEDYSKDKANNSNLGDRWASGGTAVHYANGANPNFQDWWYVDLGNEAIYDIAEIAIKWETACPNDYDIRVSADAENWTTIGTYNTYPVSSGDGSSNYQFYNNFSNSVPCRYVGVWAREGYSSLAYGISMFDFQVFGLEHVDADVDVESITLNHTSATIELGESLTLTASVAPVNATDKSITWSSDAESVATVAGGVITTHTAGTARITATANDGSGVSATCELTVDPVTDKTWWGIQRSAEWIGAKLDMDVMWSIKRNANKTLTYTVYFGGDASGIGVKQIYDGVNGDNGWHSLTGYDDVNRAASFTTEETYEKGAQLSSNPFFFFGGPRIDVPTTYRVGDSNERPSSSVESVKISHAEATVVKDETLQLSATVLPSFVENKTITWSSDKETVASVSNTGLVTAHAAGEAVITATSAADGTKKATCTITVTAELAPATWYGVGTFTNFVESKDAFAYEYSFTRASNRNVTLNVVFSEDMTPYISPDNNFGIYINNDGDHLTYDATTKTATYNFGSRADGDNITWRFYFVMENGVHETSNAVYTVGSSSNEKVYACVVDEDVDNADVLEEYKGRTAQVIVDRSFAADNLYTLVLPFDADAAMTAEKLPGQLTKLSNTIVKDNGDLRINFVDAEAIEAGVPYLYSPSADVTNPVFTGVTVSKDLQPTEPADGYAEYYGIYAPMNGTALHDIEDGYVLGGDRYLYAISALPADQTMNALRGYFVLNFNEVPGAPKPRAKVIFNSREEDSPTGIGEVQGEEQQTTKELRDGQLLIIRDGRTYNAQGQLIY